MLIGNRHLNVGLTDGEYQKLGNSDSIFYAGLPKVSVPSFFVLLRFWGYEKLLSQFKTRSYELLSLKYTLLNSGRAIFTFLLVSGFLLYMFL